MCGAYNHYGFPHQNTLRSLTKVSTEIYRTDLNGHVIVFSDGNSFEINTSYNRQPPKVNINTASVEELTKIMHIGKERASQILELRPFMSVDDLIRVHGIGPKRLEDIKRQNVAVAY